MTHASTWLMGHIWRGGGRAWCDRVCDYIINLNCSIHYSITRYTYNTGVVKSASIPPTVQKDIPPAFHTALNAPSPDCYTIELIPQRQKTSIPPPLPSNRFRDTTTIPRHHTVSEELNILPTSFSMAKRGSSPERSRLPSSARLPIHRKLGRKL